MSNILESAQEALSKKLGGDGFDGSVKFEIIDVGALIVDDSGVTISDDDADCTLIATQEIFEDLLRGNINPTAAFMTGKLKVEGDMSAAMKLAARLI
ncbi:MAG TPA: SCP2 sterol-binding domain-containing protein [Paracoccaceae bacterium]|nr:SCP2 sterol-binding domain-containing protein [Paracoccaceae bacterium]